MLVNIKSATQTHTKIMFKCVTYQCLCVQSIASNVTPSSLSTA